jgi:N-acyl-D-amino-acid deacylase
MSQEFDLVIRGGTVVDGMGGEPFVGDVAVKNGLITAVGGFAGSGEEEIAANGHIVTPGFVDVHTHYDGQITWENRLAPSSDHGVTTVVMGNCGVGFAPARQGDHELVIKLMEGVEDIPEVVMAEGVPWNWETFPDYLNALEKRQSDIDFATQLPHSPLRVYVMGERGANLEPPTEADLAEMRRLTREAIDAGALGVSSSRSLTHRFRDGRPAPSTKTEVDELLALAGGLKDAGTGVFQLIPNFDNNSAEEFAVIRKLAEASGRPVSFTLFTGERVVGGWREFATGIEKALADNLLIKGQIYPRPIGVLFGLDLSYHPFSLNPSYRAIAKLSLNEKVSVMRDPGMRKKIISEEPQDPNPFFVWMVQQTQLLFALGDPPNYMPSARDSIKARAAASGTSERELIYEELLRDEGRALLYCPMGNNENNRFDAAADLVGMPGTMLGLGDGGAHYGMICDAAYTTFMLTDYVCKKRRLPIQTVVSMLSRETSEAMGLHDRGIVRPGYKADINVIDLNRIHLYAPRTKHDLPANGRRLSQKADGYEATIVSGRVTYRNGRATGELPGRLVRGTRKGRTIEQPVAAA